MEELLDIVLFFFFFHKDWALSLLEVIWEVISQVLMFDPYHYNQNEL